MKYGVQRHKFPSSQKNIDEMKKSYEHLSLEHQQFTTQIIYLVTVFLDEHLYILYIF